MEKMSTIRVHGYCAVAALPVHVLVPTAKPRSTGVVRLLADGSFIIAPSDPPLID